MEAITVNLVLVFLSIVFGGLLTFRVSQHYYDLASRDMRQEAEHLRDLSAVLLLGMEEAGWLTATRDKLGNVSGMILNFRVEGSQGASNSDARPQ